MLSTLPEGMLSRKPGYSDHILLPVVVYLCLLKIIAESCFKRTRGLLAKMGIADFEKTHVQVSSVQQLS